ncbi:protein kinase family protein [Perilla frutescens var. hirtella]|uniref:RING-type E3 ubiquitin transferase n=1 Tax=Perilla frutescens var. hirtella TaxID=608512 RepID=A0AAD4P560_PERFH|nr:protein kinase family protein [Perilla frutescens var. hirtella]KAH6826646.1 protein kinase family protein [Perilla frutescens var. hirtella]
MANLFEEDRISTAVAIDKDKNSQSAVKWALEKLRLKDGRIAVVHVKINHGIDSYDVPKEGREPTPAETQQLFLPFRGFCARKGIRVKEVVLQGQDVASTLSEYISRTHIINMVVGASSRGAIARAFKNADVPSCLVKHAPDFCNVYSISKAKVQKLKSSSDSGTSSSSQESSLPAKFRPQESWKSTSSDASDLSSYMDGGKNGSPFNSRESRQITPRERPFGKIPSPQHSSTNNEYLQRLPGGSANTSYESIGVGSSYYNSNNFSGASDGEARHMTTAKQPGPDISEILHSMNNHNLHVRKDSASYSISESSDHSGQRSFPSEVSYEDQFQMSFASRSSASSQTVVSSKAFMIVYDREMVVTSELTLKILMAILKELSTGSLTCQTMSIFQDTEDELRRLKQEMKRITLMYNIVCQETESDGSNIQEANNSSALAIVEREKMKCKAAVELAQTAQRIAELESEKRKSAEMKFKLESEEKQKAMNALAHTEIQYRRYTMEEIQEATNYFAGSEKIGEGGYGPVFQATLDHTAVAIKVLRPDMSQGEKQFQREIDVLSRMRHPNMVILLGACPEYGCLVYEYMESGSLEDRLNCLNGSSPLSWRARFRIAVEIATALNFLHRTRPEPLVHRDLKPANILLDRNYVSKISDVGLSRLVPQSVADSITQCCMTAAAGTFCYIDPEYQQTGMLGTKSDIYSLGMVLLQILTARPAMGLTHQVETAIENDQFAEVLDQKVKDWPVEEALSMAKMALRCCELRRKDRPDLDSEILPELQRIREIGSQIKPEDRY